MGSHIDKERKICDGRVTIYQRTDVQKASWHCRIAFPRQPHIRQSLLTTNEKEAERMAEKLYRDLLYRYERGLPLKRVKFDEVAAAYFVHLEDEVNRGITKPERLTTNRIMSRYAIEYFKNRYIDTITSADINKFREWRRVYWTSGPGSKSETYTYQRNGKTVTSKKPPAREPALSTSNSENVLLRAVFNYAAAHDWITKAQIPVIDLKVPAAKKSRDAHRRPGLNQKEVYKLLGLALKRFEDTTDDRLKHQRFLLYAFVGMMAFGGMRPFECMKLRWKDFGNTSESIKDSFSKIYVSGKNKSRWLIPLDAFGGVIYFLAGHIATIEKKRKADGKPPLDFENIPIFSDLEGVPIKSLAAGFRNLLEEAGLYIDPETGKPRDSYCLRHYYATERLLAGVGVYTLAENMGTSVAMIERHYGHLKPEMAAAELTKVGKS